MAKRNAGSEGNEAAAVTVKVLRTFRDKYTNKLIGRGMTFQSDEKRVAEINFGQAKPIVEIVGSKKHEAAQSAPPAAEQTVAEQNEQPADEQEEQPADEQSESPAEALGEPTADAQGEPPAAEKDEATATGKGAKGKGKEAK